MSLILFMIVPLGWAVTGRLLAPAVSLTVATDAGRRVGAALGRWCMCSLPALYFALYFLGASGDAGHGMYLFGSEELFGMLCLSIYTVPIVGAYVVVVYVIRDLARGLRSDG